MSELQKRFKAAQAAAKSLRDKPDNDTLLEFYSYFKQASAGDAAGDRPGAFEFIARAKYDAWAARKGMGRAGRHAGLRQACGAPEITRVVIRGAQV